MNESDKRADGGIAFRCAGSGCGEEIGDPQYVGPAGHAPQNLCFECWSAHWDRVEARAANGGGWTHLDEALWLICRGLTFSQAAEVIASNPKALGRWIDRMRTRPALVPDWLIRMNQARRQRREQQHQEIL